MHRKFPNLNFVGICHELESLEGHLSPILDQPKPNIRFRVGGLNHFSVLSDVLCDDSGLDANEDVCAGAEGYVRKMPGSSEIINSSRASGYFVETEGLVIIDLSHIKDVRPWSD